MNYTGVYGLCAMSEPQVTELRPDELEQLVEHLQAEEIQSEHATLSSIESLQLWISTHPALRQMNVFENLHQFGPALLEVVKRLLGI
jgi:hypothetical protein